MSSFRLLPFLFGGAVLAVAGVRLWRRRSGNPPQQQERERRLRLMTKGRIVDGTILGIEEMTEPPNPSAQLIIYNYDVGGVTYEASQDITYLRHLIDLHACGVGLPAAVRYDPHNPSNSIVVAENWSGLRD